MFVIGIASCSQPAGNVSNEDTVTSPIQRVGGEYKPIEIKHGFEFDNGMYQASWRAAGKTYTLTYELEYKTPKNSYLSDGGRPKRVSLNIVDGEYLVSAATDSRRPMPNIRISLPSRSGQMVIDGVKHDINVDLRLLQN